MKITKTAGVLVVYMLCMTFLSTTPGIAQQNPTLSDPEVASVAVTANQIDISYAEIAKKKSKDAEVLKFAETMNGPGSSGDRTGGCIGQKIRCDTKRQCRNSKTAD